MREIATQHVDLTMLLLCYEDDTPFTVAIEPIGTTFPLAPGEEIHVRIVGALVDGLQVSRSKEFLVVYANGPDIWLVNPDGADTRIA